MRSSGKFEKGGGCGEHTMWRIMISIACRTAARGEKGSAVYWSLSTFTAWEWCSGCCPVLDRRCLVSVSPPSPSSYGRNLCFHWFVHSMNMKYNSLVQHFSTFCRLITFLENNSCTSSEGCRGRVSPTDRRSTASIRLSRGDPV